jgi:hypothetical protein
LVRDHGVNGLALGWCAASLTEAALLVVALRRRFGVKLLPAVFREIVVCSTAASVGWWLGTIPANNVLSALIGGGSAFGIAALGLRVWSPRTVTSLFALLPHSLHA